MLDEIRSSMLFSVLLWVCAALLPYMFSLRQFVLLGGSFNSFGTEFTHCHTAYAYNQSFFSSCGKYVCHFLSNIPVLLFGFLLWEEHYLNALCCASTGIRTRISISVHLGVCEREQEREPVFWVLKLIM